MVKNLDNSDKLKEDSKEDNFFKIDPFNISKCDPDILKRIINSIEEHKGDTYTPSLSDCEPHYFFSKY